MKKLICPEKPKTIAKFEEPQKKNFYDKHPVNVKSYTSIENLIKKVKEKAESKSQEEISQQDLLKHIKVSFSYGGSVYVECFDKKKFDTAYKIWQSLHDTKGYLDYVKKKNEYEKDLKLYKKRMQKIKKLIEAGEL